MQGSGTGTGIVPDSKPFTDTVFGGRMELNDNPPFYTPPALEPNVNTGNANMGGNQLSGAQDTLSMPNYAQFMQSQLPPDARGAGPPNVASGMAGGGGLQALSAQANGQAGFSNVDDVAPRKMGFAGGGQLNQLGDGPQVFGGQGPIIAANNPNQVPRPMQNPQNPQRPEGIGDFNQAEAEANAAAMVNAQGAMDEADEGNEQMQEAMTGMNYLPSDFWAGGAGHTAAVNAGLAQQQAAARAMWEEGKARQQELIDKVNQQLGEHYGGGGWGGGSGGGGGTWDEGGGGDDGGGRQREKRGPIWGEPGSNPRDTEGPASGDPRLKEMPPGIPGRRGKTPPWVIKGNPNMAGGGQGDPRIKGMPPGIPGSNTTGGIADAYLERKRREQGAGGGEGGGVLPPPNQGDPMPQGGGQPQSSVTGPTREEFWQQKYAESAANDQRRQDFLKAQNERFEQTRRQSDANQNQAFLDNLQRNFDMMTPQQRMQNADNFQRDMDKWQSRYGGGGNTREQVKLFDQIKEATGSQRLRGFANQNNPMQFNDQQLREQSRMQQGPQQKQELPMFGQEGYGAMIRQRQQQQGNPNSLEALRQRATSPQQRIATNKQYPTGSQFAGTRPSTRTGTAGLNTLAKRAKPRMNLSQMYGN